MTEKTAIVTGASSGIGLCTALALAQRGMRVVMVGRDPARTEAARRYVASRCAEDRLATALADYSDLAAVRRLAEEILASEARIDVLVNNAGLIASRYEQTPDGYELTFAVNHLAPFLLTNLLLARLAASAPSRIVTVASAAHRGARLELQTINASTDWGALKAYGRSNLCNILFTRELALRIGNNGVVASCLHPGVVATGIARHGLMGLGWRLGKPFMLTPEKGAETSVFLATVENPRLFHGAYVIGREIATPDPAALDDRLARALWEESAHMVGLGVQ